MDDGASLATANQLWRLNLEGRVQLASGQAVPLSSAVASEELAALLTARYPGCERFPTEGRNAGNNGDPFPTGFQD